MNSRLTRVKMMCSVCVCMCDRYHVCTEAVDCLLADFIKHWLFGLPVSLDSSLH